MISERSCSIKVREESLSHQVCMFFMWGGFNLIFWRFFFLSVQKRRIFFDAFSRGDHGRRCQNGASCDDKKCNPVRNWTPLYLSLPDFECSCTPLLFFWNFYLKNFIQQRHWGAAWGLSVQQIFFFGLDYFLLFTASSLSPSSLPQKMQSSFFLLIETECACLS